MGIFKREVEVGRVALVNYGPHNGKLAVIVDIVDHNRALVDFVNADDSSKPLEGNERQALAYRHMILTNQVVKGLPKGARQGVVGKYLKETNVLEAWKKSAWATKLNQRKVRANLTDFERFKVRKLHNKRRFIVGPAIAQAKKTAATA